MKPTCVVITVTGDVVLHETEDISLPFLQQQCGGFVNALAWAPDVTLWVANAADTLPMNPLLSLVNMWYGNFGGRLVGPGLVTGGLGVDTVPLTEGALQLVMERTALARKILLAAARGEGPLADSAAES